ncbi:MAG: hypothetical protein GYB68_11725 [Chloroflexi bacterium]|nr:hypothetical protein [Chloroflexota bacterium]
MSNPVPAQDDPKDNERSQRPTHYLFVVVFLSGMSVLAIELSASRLLGPVFGTSNLIWANVIGLILVYLTVGYVIGGRWADRSPYPETLFRVISWGALLVALIPLLARPVLNVANRVLLASDGLVVISSFVVTLILFAAPVTLLAMVSPFVIRILIESTDTAGQLSGQIYAVSTVGSILGSFLPSLVLIPWLGTTLTFLVISALLMTLALIGMLLVNRANLIKLSWMPAAQFVVALILIIGLGRS